MNDDYKPTGGLLFDRFRSYDGQSHTDAGERGRVTLKMFHPILDIVEREDRPLPENPTITLRDISDAVLIGVLHAKKRPDAQYTSEVFGPGSYSDEVSLSLPPERIETRQQLWAELSKDPDFSPVAAAQNAAVEIEKRLGIYPNVPQPRFPDERTES